MDDELRAYLLGKNPKRPAASDLVGQWDLLPEDQSEFSAREKLVWRYYAYSFTDRWAWDALGKLLRTLRKRREPIPPRLVTWAFDVAGGRIHPLPDILGDGRRPPARVGRPTEDERDVRIYYTFQILRRRETSREEAIDAIGKEVHLSAKGVISVLRKVKTKGLLDENSA